MAKRTPKPIDYMPDEEAEQIVQDAAVIGKAMLKSIRELAQQQQRPVDHFIQATIQALIGVNSIVCEERKSNAA